jgi:alanine dehydrogenase
MSWDSPQTVGVLREVKAHERRVALTPDGARTLVGDGRGVVVESGAGVGAGYADEEYVEVGAVIANSAKEVAERSALLLHVKEPQTSEFDLFRAHHTLFTYLHLAAAPDVAEALCSSGCRAIAYESVEVNRTFPLLAPMSAVAGRLAAQSAAMYLEARNGGRGVLFGGIPGVPPARVLVIGAGVSGRHAAEVAAGMGAEVVVADLDERRAVAVAREIGGHSRGIASGPGVVESLAPTCDVIIGAVLVPGRAAPTVIKSATLASMAPGSVIIDIAIDQGGCVEGVQSTTHQDPIREMGHVRVSATPNMPAAVPRTSTAALTAATLPYVRALAAGWPTAIARHPELVGAVNVENGSVVHPDVVASLKR